MFSVVSSCNSVLQPHRYFWISVPLKHHYKKCPVMWTRERVITKNSEISVSSRNNPEMSQCSSDVPMLVNFSIYIFPWDLLWTGLYRWKYYFSIDYNANQRSETFNKSQIVWIFWCFCRVLCLTPPLKPSPSTWPSPLEHAKTLSTDLFKLHCVAFSFFLWSFSVMSCHFCNSIFTKAESKDLFWKICY